MSEDIWDTFSTPNSGDFPPSVKFETYGDTVVGTIVKIVSFKTQDGRVVPDIHFVDDNGVTRSVICGQTDLLRQLIECDPKPAPGDRIAIKYLSQRKAGLYMQKVFDVAVGPGDGTEVGPSPEVANVKTAADLL